MQYKNNFSVTETKRRPDDCRLLNQMKCGSQRHDTTCAHCEWRQHPKCLSKRDILFPIPQPLEGIVTKITDEGAHCQLASLWFKCRKGCSGSWMLDTGYWILGTGCFTLGSPCRIYRFLYSIRCQLRGYAMRQYNCISLPATCLFFVIIRYSINV